MNTEDIRCTDGRMTFDNLLVGDDWCTSDWRRRFSTGTVWIWNQKIIFTRVRFLSACVKFDWVLYLRFGTIVLIGSFAIRPRTRGYFSRCVESAQFDERPTATVIAIVFMIRESLFVCEPLHLSAKLLRTRHYLIKYLIKHVMSSLSSQYLIFITLF